MFIAKPAYWVFLFIHLKIVRYRLQVVYLYLVKI